MRNEISGFGRSRRNLAKALFERYPESETPQQTASTPEEPRLAELAPVVARNPRARAGR
jgi:hypothetical protein